MHPASESSTGHLEATIAEVSQSVGIPVTAAQAMEAPGRTQAAETSTGKDRAAATPPRTTDGMDSLASEIKRAVSKSEDLVKDGLAPVPFIFSFEPGERNSDQAHAFSRLLGMTAIVRMFAAVNIVATRQTLKQPESYSLAKPAEYLSAFKEVTDATIKALTVGPLASFYDSSSGGSTQTEEQVLERSEIHKFVLSRVFGGLPQVSQHQLEQDIDHTLTQLVAQLKPFKATSEMDQNTLKHVILINYVKTTDLTGSGTVLVVDAYTRMVTLNIKVKDWFAALQKPKTGPFKKPEKIRFGMTMTVIDMKLNGAKYNASKARYEQTLEMMVDGQPELQEIFDRGGLEAYGRETTNILPACESSVES
ncbi:hypothetical protein GGR55DRAFT_629261 [Xylaria sp. FL0064]|nr:hypothetical protein GGR55DRAFT_629261 [Xylaria sp. FL0064]